MEDVIVYQTNITSPAELTEYYHNQGFEPKLVHSIGEIASLDDERPYKKLFLEINCLSDILKLNAVQSLYGNAEIFLIVKPQLEEIVHIIKSGSYRIVKDITNYTYKMGRKP